MKSTGNTASKITKDENDENDPHLETTEVILLVNGFQEVCIHLFPVNLFVNY